METKIEADWLVQELTPRAYNNGLDAIAIQGRARDGTYGWFVAFTFPRRGEVRSPLFRHLSSANGWLTKWENGHA